MKHINTLREHGDKPVSVECRNEFNYCILCNDWFPRRDYIEVTYSCGHKETHVQSGVASEPAYHDHMCAPCFSDR